MNPRASDSRVKAVLGPTNTGKTHLAIERLCAHSSGAIGFPLRLLAREVYDKVKAIKGERSVALITGEERIEPPQARWLLCTAEAMPRSAGEFAFIALDEAQLAADPERGHIFTDRLLNARGRDETMLLGSATIEPLVKALVPEAEIVKRPRFSTLRHAGSAKLSRIPPRSAIVAFSAEQVYAVAEMLRRFRGGAAVVMGALSPETRNRQVELFQSGEVDYIVATDAIGMGLNLDVTHVAFAGLGKFDGHRQRRLTPAEMAQIAGRAGRHQKDGTFGTLSGMRGSGALEFTPEEIYAIEEHRFAPLTKLFWRESDPRFDTIDTLIGDLEAKPGTPQLAPAPEGIDLKVLKRLADEPGIAGTMTSPALVRRFWDACSLPDFRQQGAETHSRFVLRLWQELRDGYLGADYAAAKIAELDNLNGDIDALQGRISAIRSWAYIAQRPDWLLAKDEMAARARTVEGRLSDALHQRLTERFVNRRTSVLMKTMGKDAALLKVELSDDGIVLVEGEAIGHLEGFRFVVDAQANHADRKLLLAAAEKHLPQLLALKAQRLAASELGELKLDKGMILRDGQPVAALHPGKDASRPRLELAKELGALGPAQRGHLSETLALWLEAELAPLAPLRKLEEASRDPEAGSEVRALLLQLIAGAGMIAREKAGLAHVPKEKRHFLRRLGVTIGTLDIFVPALLKPGPRRLLRAIGIDRRPLQENMAAVIEGARNPPSGYRQAGRKAIRLDMAEKLFRAAHDGRGAAKGRRFRIDLALGTSMGLVEESFSPLMREAGFRPVGARALAEGAFGPPAPLLWEWRPPRPDSPRPERTANERRHQPRAGKGAPPKGKRPPPKPAPEPQRPAEGNAFAALAGLIR
ncbi:MAG: helicase-related protein [Candidatus Andeanibacterium colombiense]|uniref:Helicase-related protein n=1 Tax=Candidatus Andeanibacterium colombiense TaxID=3121345 RepID=A0AAJ5X4J8_9SPHN|nr:MAG: helicase-related protein [Sphingomonadaceae bacterium]